MKLYSLGSLIIHEQVMNLDKETCDFSSLAPGSTLICWAHDLTAAYASIIVSNSGINVVAVGASLPEDSQKMLEQAADRVYVLPYFDRYGSTKKFFSQVREGKTEKKGIFRFVSCGMLDDPNRCKNSIRFNFTSLVFLLSMEFGAVKTNYIKLFELENMLRFNAIIKFENQSIFFFEEKFSASMLKSEYWEYGFPEGLLVSDSFRASPLWITTAQGSTFMDYFRLGGTLEEVNQALLDTSITLRDFTDQASRNNVSKLISSIMC